MLTYFYNQIIQLYKPIYLYKIFFMQSDCVVQKICFSELNDIVFSFLISRENRSASRSKLQERSESNDRLPAVSQYISVTAGKTYRIIRWLLNCGMSAVSVISAFRRSVRRTGVDGFVQSVDAHNHTFSVDQGTTILPRQINLYVSQIPDHR